MRRMSVLMAYILDCDTKAFICPHLWVIEGIAVQSTEVSLAWGSWGGCGWGLCGWCSIVRDLTQSTLLHVMAIWMKIMSFFFHMYLLEYTVHENIHHKSFVPQRDARQRTRSLFTKLSAGAQTVKHVCKDTSNGSWLVTLYGAKGQTVCLSECRHFWTNQQVSSVFENACCPLVLK